MFKRLGMAAVVLGSALAMSVPAVAQEWRQPNVYQNGYGYNYNQNGYYSNGYYQNGYRLSAHERHEMAERARRERDRELRERREWREHHYRDGDRDRYDRDWR